MEYIEYYFSKIPSRTSENYFYQMTNRRKLSGICHSHDFYEFICVVDGECVHLVQGEEFRMQRGDVFLLEPGVWHCFLSQNERAEVLGLSVEREEFLRFANAYGAPLPDIIAEKRFFKIPIQELVFLYPDRMEHYSMQLLLSKLIYYLLAYQDSPVTAMPKNLADALIKMQEIEHLQEGIGALTRLSNYSHTHLQRLIKKYLGVSIHTYILELRMQTAYQMLVSSDLCIPEIAEQVGYQSLSHFCQTFKRFFGITPASLRRSGGIQTV